MSREKGFDLLTASIWLPLCRLFPAAFEYYVECDREWGVRGFPKTEPDTDGNCDRGCEGDADF